MRDDNTDIQKGKGSNFYSILQNTGMIRVVNYLQLPALQQSAYDKCTQNRRTNFYLPI